MTDLSGSERRLILVVYNDGSHDLVESYFLDYLIATGRVKRFCRASGWVDISHDPVRSGGGGYHGRERRSGKRNRRGTATAGI